MRLSTAEYQAESDPLQDFIAEMCAIGPECGVRAAELYRAYTTYTTEAWIRPADVLSNTRFGRLMSNRFTKEHDRQGSFYAGIGLRGQEAQGQLDGEV